MLLLRLLGLIILSMNGVGHSALYALGALAVYTSWALQNYELHDYKLIGFVLSIASITLLIPELLQLSSILIATSIILKDFKTATALALISLVNVEAYFGFSYLLILIGPVVIIVSRSISATYQRSTAYASFILFILHNVVTIFSFPGLSVPAEQKNARAYQVGGTYGNLGINASSGGIVALEGDRHIEPSDTTIYGEHDTFVIGGKEIGEQNYQQHPRWLGRQFMGPEMIRCAVSMDGFHAVNFGMELAGKGRTVLSHQSFFKIHHLISIRDGKLIAGDSDSFVNRLAPYQRHLLVALNKGSPFGLLYTFMYYILLSFILVARKVWIKKSLLLLGIASLALEPLIWGSHGDIRYIGKVTGWPHTERAYGIVRHMQDNGKNYVFGDKSTSILVIDKGLKGEIRPTEKLIIAGNGAQIKAPNGTYYIGTVPFGTKNGIINAYGIYNSQKKLISEGILTVSSGAETYTIIATDSPGLLPIDLLE